MSKTRVRNQKYVHEETKSRLTKYVRCLLHSVSNILTSRFMHKNVIMKINILVCLGVKLGPSRS
jgi:hypothetical protein